MKITKSQQEKIRSEIRRGIIISAAFTFIFASYIFRLPLRFSTTLVTIVFFFLFATAYLLQINPPAAKALRAYLAARPRLLLLAPALLWLFSAIYSILVGAFSGGKLAVGLVYCLVPSLLLYRFFPEKETFSWSDALALILIWLPVELNYFSQPTIPVIDGAISILGLVAIILTVFLFTIVGDVPELGLTFQWRYQDIERAFWYFLLFVAVVGIPVGFAGQLFAISSSFPSLEQIFISVFFVYFFIALPEELVFRGIIQNVLSKKLENIKNGGIISIAIASLLFAGAHIFMKHLPFFSGSSHLLHKPVAYFLLSAGAGIFYGLAFIKTRKVTAAALTHTLVDLTIFLFLCD